MKNCNILVLFIVSFRLTVLIVSIKNDYIMIWPISLSIFGFYTFTYSITFFRKVTAQENRMESHESTLYTEESGFTHTHS